MQTLAPYSKQTLQLAHCQPLKIVALGDSLVYGFGDPEGGGWVERLRRNWMSPQSAGHVLYNLGVRGDRVTQVTHRLEQEFRLRGEIRNRVPDIMILSVGVNDSARVQRPDGRNYTDFAAFTVDLASLLDRAQQLCPVLFVGMAPVDEAKMPFLDCLYYNHKDQALYNGAIQQACRERGIPFLNIFERWLQRGDHWLRSHLSEDGLHPNVAGYQALHQDVLQWKPIAELDAGLTLL